MYRFTRRNAIITCVVIVWLIFYLASSWRTPLESVQLEHHMNHASAGSESTFGTESSFDWSHVPYKYPDLKVRPLPSGRASRLPKIQHTFGSESGRAARTRQARRKEVRELFVKNWRSYRKYAWKKDALLPISGGFKDQFCGWSATLVDSLDTLWIMGLRLEFDEAVDAVGEIDFGKATCGRVNTFETNIRYLGGLLAAYDLSKRPVLLLKATELGDMLLAAFNTENRMPVDFFGLDSAKSGEGLEVEPSVVSASPGTLSMELTHLSQLTADSKYYSAVSQVMDVFYRHQNETSLPGLWPMFVSMRRQDVSSGNRFTIAGCADSLYEYLPKMHALLSGREAAYEALSQGFLGAANASLFFRPMLPGNDDILVAGTVDVNERGRQVLDPESEHLACFMGGVYALSGRLFKNRAYIDIGAKLTRGCVYAYKAFPTGMMPERFNMVPCRSRQDCSWSEDTWTKERKEQPEWRDHLPKGFTTAKDPRYILRPEAIESVFILYRITGDAEYMEAAWEMFTAISNGTATEYANAAVLDVTKVVVPLPQEDYMEVRCHSTTLNTTND
jgi:mannosyl-oligosaccharide alpha-1,2-mannosidase